VEHLQRLTLVQGLNCAAPLATPQSMRVEQLVFLLGYSPNHHDEAFLLAMFQHITYGKVRLATRTTHFITPQSSGPEYYFRAADPITTLVSREAMGERKCFTAKVVQPRTHTPSQLIDETEVISTASLRNTRRWLCKSAISPLYNPFHSTLSVS
jgi:hypothetical protein